MSEQNQLISLLLATIRGGDADVLQDERVLGKVCAAEHLQRVRSAAEFLGKVYAQFDFTESPAFAQEVASRSAAYVSMLAKRYREPIMRAKKREELQSAFRQLLHSDAAFSLVPAAQHPQLIEARASLRAASAPN